MPTFFAQALAERSMLDAVITGFAPCRHESTPRSQRRVAVDLIVGVCLLAWWLVRPRGEDVLPGHRGRDRPGISAMSPLAWQIPEIIPTPITTGSLLRH